MSDPIPEPAEPTPPLIEPFAFVPVHVAPLPPPRPRLSRLVWVFAALIVVQLAGAAVAAVAYVDDRKTAAARLAAADAQVHAAQLETDAMKRVLDSQDRNLTDDKAKLADLQKKAQSLGGCEAAVQALVDAATRNDIPGQQPLLAAMATACGAT
jgi:hypothetical protein